MPRLVLLVLFTGLSYVFGLGAGLAWLLPLLNAVPAYLVMADALRRGQRAEAVRAMLVWAAAMAVFGTLTMRFWSVAPTDIVLHGRAYRDEMFDWIRTGQGTEGSPWLFLPQHALHLLAFVVLSLLTASAASIFMGAVLMNSMSLYVASLGRAGVPASAALLFGWQPWALLRVAAYCVLGVVLAEPLLSRLLRYRYPGLAASKKLLLWVAAALLADVVLKAALAPTWGRALRPLLP